MSRIEIAKRLAEAHRAEFNALCYLVVSIIALLFAAALVAWAIWA